MFIQCLLCQVLYDAHSARIFYSLLSLSREQRNVQTAMERLSCTTTQAPCLCRLSFIISTSSGTAFLLSYTLCSCDTVSLLLFLTHIRDIQFRGLGSCQVLQIEHSSRYIQLCLLQLFNYSCPLNFTFNLSFLPTYT